MENTGQGLVSGGGWQAFLASFDCGHARLLRLQPGWLKAHAVHNYTEGCLFASPVGAYPGVTHYRPKDQIGVSIKFRYRGASLLRYSSSALAGFGSVTAAAHQQQVVHCTLPCL